MEISFVWETELCPLHFFPHWRFHSILFSLYMVWFLMRTQLWFIYLFFYRYHFFFSSAFLQDFLSLVFCSLNLLCLGISLSFFLFFLYLSCLMFCLSVLDVWFSALDNSNVLLRQIFFSAPFFYSSWYSNYTWATFWNTL